MERKRNLFLLLVFVTGIFAAQAFMLMSCGDDTTSPIAPFVPTKGVTEAITVNNAKSLAGLTLKFSDGGFFHASLNGKAVTIATGSAIVLPGRLTFVLSEDNQVGQTADGFWNVGQLAVDNCYFLVTGSSIPTIPINYNIAGDCEWITGSAKVKVDALEEATAEGYSDSQCTCQGSDYVCDNGTNSLTVTDGCERATGGGGG